jgi:hypothetical protein
MHRLQRATENYLESDVRYLDNTILASCNPSGARRVVASIIT